MSDFHKSAFDVRIHVGDDEVLLKAALKTTNGQVRFDTIKLNDHIGNDHGKPSSTNSSIKKKAKFVFSEAKHVISLMIGKFIWGGRDFHKTAKDLTFIHEHGHKPILMGWLGDGNRGVNYVSIVLSEKIGNDDGKFVVSG